MTFDRESYEKQFSYNFLVHTNFYKIDLWFISLLMTSLTIDDGPNIECPF